MAFPAALSASPRDSTKMTRFSSTSATAIALALHSAMASLAAFLASARVAE
jgi:hypothetical protein